MIAMGIAAAAKILMRPATEYQTATAEMLKPLSRVIHAMSLSVFVIFI
jgi:hypothetical protein